MAFIQDAKKTGSLTIVGSGITSVGQFTLQAISAIEHATKVFYVIGDPVAESYVRSKNKDCFDLGQYYDNSKPRIDTYVQMAEAMLREVRAGCKVVGVFYGHPGVFVLPSHRAMSIAREEGYQAKMLPGISAEDCLYADLEIDPAIPGCFMYEATDYLVREKQADTTSHLILWQVGVVGMRDFHFKGYSNANFGVLMDRLEQDYGKDYKLVHYMAAILPHLEPTIQELSFAQLRDPETVKSITACSTFYIPPKSMKPPNAKLAEKLGLNETIKATETTATMYYPPLRWGPLSAGSEAAKNVVAYGDAEEEAIAAMANHVRPSDYLPLRASKSITDATLRLATDETALELYKKHPEAFVEQQHGLTAAESAALQSGTVFDILSVMKAVPDTFVKAVREGGTIAMSTPVAIIFVVIIIAI